MGTITVWPSTWPWGCFWCWTCGCACALEWTCTISLWAGAGDSDLWFMSARLRSMQTTSGGFDICCCALCGSLVNTCGDALLLCTTGAATNLGCIIILGWSFNTRPIVEALYRRGFFGLRECGLLLKSVILLGCPRIMLCMRRVSSSELIEFKLRSLGRLIFDGSTTSFGRFSSSLFLLPRTNSVSCSSRNAPFGTSYSGISGSGRPCMPLGCSDL